MEQPDLSNPLVVVTAFFGILITALATIVKILPMAIASGGVIGGIAGLIGGLFVFFKIMLGD